MESNILSKIAGNEVDPSTIMSVADMTPEQEKMINDLNDAKAAVGAQQFTPEQIQAMMARMKTKQIVRDHKKIGRNDPCPCGSGKKYKNCCLNKGTYEGTHTV